MPFMYVEESEREDFERELRSRNRSLDDFEIVDAPDRLDPPGDGVRPVVSEVVIRSRKNGAERTYSRGGVNVSYDPLVRWVREFITDLNAGVFG
jgi:hypothetical protein